ncbi:hypothetical protein DFH29DRAFT_880999 [Suillus ampliporus]|nr:hypothetical protein DFH29DRAFT_880999 [Suillus ampliporus]
MANDDHQLQYISAYGRDLLIENPENDAEAYRITRDQLRAFVAYSHTLRNSPCPLPSMDQVNKMVWHTALSALHQQDKMEACRALQKKTKNFGRKQEQKLTKKGLGKVKKDPTGIAASGSGSACPSTSNPKPVDKEVMNFSA